MPSNGWQAATREVLDRLDLEAEYRELGVRPAGKPSAKGWMPCRVFGNPDERNPSAGINVSGEHPQLGRYKEFTGEGRNVSFFEFAAAVAGRFSSWEEARQHYAERAGVELPKEKRPKSPEDNLVFRDWIEHQVAAWCSTKPPITPEAVRDAGGRLAGWPAKSQAHTVVSLPIYGPHLTDADPAGWLIWNKTGRPLPLFRGKGEAPEPKKMLIVGGSTSGWMGRWGLDHLDTAEVTWKVEGPGDMLALMSAIPEELRSKHVVIANAGGSREKLAPEFWEPLRGKAVYVVHDCDRDGQLGGQEQAQLAAQIAAEVRHVTLPFEIAEKHGRDLRDWIAEGHVYQELIDMAGDSPPMESEAAPDPRAGNGQPPADYDPMSQDRSICSEIGLDVLGEHPDREILVFSERLAKSSVIPRINSFSFADLLQVAGPAVREHVHTSQDAPPGSHHFNRVREAIATLAGRKRIRDQEARGAGVWPGEEGQVVIVGGGEAATYSPEGRLEVARKPIAAGQLLDLGGARWQDFGRLREDLAAADDKPWRERAVNEALELFGRWRWREGCEHYLVTGLVLAGWVQTLWAWRPHVAISAESGGGKSTLLAAIRDLCGPLALYSAKPTEAGFRQAIRNRACIPLIDEFEADRHRRAILELLRTAGTGTTILRGTRDQHGVEYGLRHICWVAGVEAGLHRQPDRNRFLMLDLLPPKPDARNQLRVPPAEDLRDLGQRLLAIALWGIRDAMRLAGVLRQEQLGELDARTIESLAVPAAALSVAMGLSDREAREMLAMLALQVDGQDGGEQESDQETLLQDILASVVRLNHSAQATVAELIRLEIDSAWDALARVGIAAASDDPGKPPESWERTWLFLSPRPLARQLLRDTEWAEQALGQILARLPGAEKSRGYINGHRCRGVRIPFSLIRELVGSDGSVGTF